MIALVEYSTSTVGSPAEEDTERRKMKQKACSEIGD